MSAERTNAGPDIIANLAQRWSPRAFDETIPVTDEQLRMLLEAARWAPSCFNEQPWSFVVTRKGDDDHARLLDCLMPKNQLWAGSAPVLLLSVAHTVFSHNGKSNRHAVHDVGLAVSQLIQQGMAIGLSVHQMAGFSVDKARSAFSIPDEYAPVAAIALGTPGSPDILPPDLRETELAPRTRKPLSEMAFGGHFGQPSPLAD
jgi:nitroreductase